MTLPSLKTSRNPKPAAFGYSRNMKFIREELADIPSVIEVEAAPTGRQLYVWLDDGRSGVVDMSEWTGHPCDKWDTEGFDRWRVDAGMPCWGEDSHISPDLCVEELLETPYDDWADSFKTSVFAVRKAVI